MLLHSKKGASWVSVTLVLLGIACILLLVMNMYTYSLSDRSWSASLDESFQTFKSQFTPPTSVGEEVNPLTKIFAQENVPQFTIDDPDFGMEDGLSHVSQQLARLQQQVEALREFAKNRPAMPGGNRPVVKFAPAALPAPDNTKEEPLTAGPAATAQQTPPSPPQPSATPPPPVAEPHGPQMAYPSVDDPRLKEVLIHPAVKYPNPVNEGTERQLMDEIRRMAGETNGEPDFSVPASSSHTFFLASALRELRRSMFGNISRWEGVMLDPTGYRLPPTTDRGKHRKREEYTPEEIKVLEDTWKNVEVRDVVVVLKTGHMLGDNFVKDHKCKLPDGRAFTCSITTDSGRDATADAHIYHIPNSGAVPPRNTNAKDGRQRRAAISMEGEMNYPAMTAIRREFREEYERSQDKSLHGILMDYRLDSDVPAVYGFYNDDTKPLPLEQRERAALYLQSNCVGYRDGYVQELMKHFPVHAGGSCLHNHNVDVDRGSYWRNVGVYARYKFALCFENSVSDFYVTERVYHALESGALPIYMGAPNADLILPERSVIFAADFPSPKALGEYLRVLDQNDDLYNEYHKWRLPGAGGIGPQSNLNRLLAATQLIEPECRLGIKILHKCDRNCPCGGKMIDNSKYYNGKPWNMTAVLPFVRKYVAEGGR